MLLQSDLADPTDAFEHLDVVGSPPAPADAVPAGRGDDRWTRSCCGPRRSGRRGGPRTVARPGPSITPPDPDRCPIASGLPVVVTLLDLAPWEMPDVFGRSAAGRFGRRLRAQLIREAAAVIVGTEATARATARLLHVKRDRIRVVPLAPRPAYSFWGSDTADDQAATTQELAAQRERLGLPERYLVYPGRYDARQDLGHAAGGARRPGRGRPTRRPARDRPVAAAGPARGRRRRTIAPPWPGRPRSRASATP